MIKDKKAVLPVLAAITPLMVIVGAILALLLFGGVFGLFYFITVNLLKFVGGALLLAAAYGLFIAKKKPSDKNIRLMLILGVILFLLPFILPALKNLNLASII